MVERIRRMDAETRGVGASVLHVSEDTQLKPGDQLVVVDSTDAAVTITMPSLSEAAGRFYYVEAPVGATNDVSVFDKEGTEIGDMDANDDHNVWFCTGTRWLDIYDGIA